MIKNELLIDPLQRKLAGAAGEQWWNAMMVCSNSISAEERFQPQTLDRLAALATTESLHYVFVAPECPGAFLRIQHERNKSQVMDTLRNFLGDASRIIRADNQFWRVSEFFLYFACKTDGEWRSGSEEVLPILYDIEPALNDTASM